MTEARSAGHRGGLWAGGVVFGVGLAMMLGVFALAVIAFFRVPAALAGPGQSMGRSLAVAAVQIGFLFVMAYLSSLFASKGLELFAAARDPERSRGTAARDPERSRGTAARDPERSRGTAARDPEPSRGAAARDPEPSRGARGPEG